MESYKNFKPFKESEAWGLFRIAALAEAVGWTILIIGILFKKYFLPGNVISIPLAGSVHGTLFMVYVAAVIIFAPSQGWSMRKTLIAGIASVPPYGSLIFEQWAARNRHRADLRRSLSLLGYYQILNQD